MRIVFMGTPEFAVLSLEALAACHDVVAVYTRPDAVRGRGSKCIASPVKEAADALGIAVHQPRTLRDADEVATLAEIDPELVVVAAYGLILPAEVLDVPRHGIINVHASLLPRWRGAAPVQRAILAGDDTTGVAIMRVEEGLDTGPFCLTAQVDVDDLDTAALTHELALAGAALVCEAADRIAEGTCVWTQQDEAQATYANKVVKADVALLPDLAPEDLLRRLRAASPSAPARLKVGGHPMTAIAGARSDAAVVAGSASVSREGLVLGTLGGAIVLTRIKPDGRGEMSAADWARGARLSEDATWSGEA